MRPHVRLLTLAVAGIVAAACSSSTSPTSGSTGGGHSATIVASSTTTGGAYGSGGNYFFNPSPDTVAAGSTVTWMFGTVTHTVHFAAGQAGAPDSIPATNSASVGRMFTTPGTYVYHCTIHNFNATLVVK